MLQELSGIEYYKKQGEHMMQQVAERRQRMRQMKFDTIAVHGVYHADEALNHGQGSIIEPLYLSAAQHFENSDHLQTALAYEMPSWAYTRIANPTLSYLEETLALLEAYGFAGDASAACYASGMAAVLMATHPFLEGQYREPVNIVVSAKCYGGSFMLFSERYAKERGIEIRWVESPNEISAWAEKIDVHTRFLYGEMPSNPGLDVIDIRALAELAHAQEIPLIIDSTLATPALCRPLIAGADIVIHSLSKMMGAGGLAIGGVVIARHHMVSRFGCDALKENFAHYIKLLPGRDFGAALSPFNALLLLNDLRLLRSRVDELSHKAMNVASFLSEHPGVERVFYPGLDGHPDHVLAKQQMQLVDSLPDHPVHRYGNLLSFTVQKGAQNTRRVFDRLRLIWRATDLGRIKSVATIPAISTHQQQGEVGRKLAKLPDNMIRLSIGNEAPEDIIADLEQALVSA